MEQIATQAGVAVQTVYYTFRTKGQLLCEVVEVTAAGDPTWTSTGGAWPRGAGAGWTIPNYKAWLFATHVQQLFGAEQLNAKAFQDLTYGELLLEG